MRAEDCNSTGSSQTSQRETCSGAGLTHHADITHLQRKDDAFVGVPIALVKLEQVTESRTNRVQWEKVYRVNQEMARQITSGAFRTTSFRMGIPWRFPFTSEQSNAEVVDPFMALSKLVRPFKIIESSPITSPWL